MINRYILKVFFIDKDYTMIKSINQIFQLFKIKYTLYLWHFLKNIIKNLNKILRS